MQPGNEPQRALEELRALDHEVDQVSDLMGLKPIYYRLEAISQQYPNHPDVQAAVSMLRQHILTRGKRLKEGPGSVSNEFPPTPAEAAVAAPSHPLPTMPPPGTMRPAPVSLGGLEPGRPAAAPPPSSPLISGQMPAHEPLAAPRGGPPVAKPPGKSPVAPPPIMPKPPAAPPPVSAWKRAVLAGSAIGLIAFAGLIVMIRAGKKKSALPPAGSIAVEVKTAPPGASIKINNETRCTSDCRIDLAPGTYQVQAELPGYEPAVASVNVAPGAPPFVNLTLQALPQVLRIYTDMTEPNSGKVTFDDQPSVDLQEGQFVLDRVPLGKHTVKVSGRMGEATFSFETAPASPPSLTGPITAKNLVAVVLSNFGTRGRLYGTGPAKVALNGQPAGEAGPNGLDVTSPAPGDQELLWGEGKDQRKFQVNFGPAPALTVNLKADVNAGTLVIVTGEDDVKVFLNGKEYRRATQRGQLRVQLGVREYTVRVAKDGYQEAPEQKVQIAKGEERRLEFKLQPVPRVAALQIHGGPAGAVVMLGQTRLGVVGPDGSFSGSNIPPGDHTVELHKDQFVSKRIARQFRAGETVTLQGGEVALERAMGTIRVVVTPAEARLTIRRADESQARAVSGTSLQVPEGSYVVGATAPGYTSRSSPVQIAAGETKTVDLQLTREKAAPVVKTAAVGMEEWDDAKGWTKEGDWLAHKGGNFVTYKITPASGTFSFTVALLKGKRVQWFAGYKDQKNHALFQLERKQLIVKDVVNGKTTERKKTPHPLDKTNIYHLQIDISKDSISTQIYDGQKWILLDKWDQSGRSFSDGKFGFLIPGSDQYGLADFKFTPR